LTYGNRRDEDEGLRCKGLKPHPLLFGLRQGAAQRFPFGRLIGEGKLQEIDMSGKESGSIYQDLTTTVGTTYNVSYWLAGNPDGAPTVKTLGVYADGTLIQTSTFDKTGHDKTHMGWTQKNITFKATGATTELKFASLNDPSTSPYGPALDNVQVTVAPEPSSLAVFAFLGLGMLGLALKARKGRATA
jgi:choice-of-anchor C domain-containing protein